MNGDRSRPTTEQTVEAQRVTIGILQQRIRQLTQSLHKVLEERDAALTERDELAVLSELWKHKRFPVDGAICKRCNQLMVNSLQSTTLRIAVIGDQCSVCGAEIVSLEQLKKGNDQ